jgi:DNA polymerase I
MIMTLMGYEYKNDEFVLLFYDEIEQKMVPVPGDRLHRPYFLVEPNTRLPDVDSIIGTKTVKKHNGILDRDAEYKVVYTERPGDINEMRLVLDPAATREDHIFYHLCYAYDKKLVYSCPHVVSGNTPHLPFTFSGSLMEFDKKIADFPFINFKRGAIDIETLPEGDRPPRPENPTKPIIAIAVAGTDGNEKVYLLNSKPQDQPVVQKGSYSYYESEKQMLIDFFRDVKAYPVKVTFNGDDFDLAYILARALALKIFPVSIIKKRKAFAFTGSIHLDMFKFFSDSSIRIYAFQKKYAAIKPKLNDLAKTFLDDSKLPQPDFLTADVDEIGAYCLKDAKITLALTTFDNGMVMNLITMLSRLANMDMETVCRRSVSSWIRSKYQFVHRLFNYVVPNSADLKRFNPEEKVKFRGAIVLDPEELRTRGYHFDVWGFDYGSLYPMNLINHNISYDTVFCGHEECKKNIVPETDVYICTKRKGILVLMFESLATLRLKIYKPMAKAEKDPVKKSWLESITNTIKVFMNAGYGVFGDNDLEDLYCLPVSQSIAAYSRAALTLAMGKSEALGGQVIIGHTDSLFIKKLTKENAAALSQEVSRELNIDFEIHGHYKFMSAWMKANYLKITDEGKVEVTGMLMKKRHICRYIRGKAAELEEALALIGDEETLRLAREEIFRICKKTKTDLYAGEVPLADLASAVMLHMSLGEGSETSQDYRVGRIYEKVTGNKLDVYDSIAKVYVDIDLLYEGKMTHFSALPIEAVENHTWLNKAKYLEHAKSVFGQVLIPMGIDPETALEGYKKTELVQFQESKQV